MHNKVQRKGIFEDCGGLNGHACTLFSGSSIFISDHYSYARLLVVYRVQVGAVFASVKGVVYNISVIVIMVFVAKRACVVATFL